MLSKLAVHRSTKSPLSPATRELSPRESLINFKPRSLGEVARLRDGEGKGRDLVETRHNS